MRILKNIKMQKNVNSIVISLIFIFFAACSSSYMGLKEDNVKWDYAPLNPYPSVMKEVKCERDTPCVLIELKPESLQLDCTLRNDSPYYWCGVSGKIKYPDTKLPERVDTVFHSVVSKVVKKNTERLIKRLKESGKPVFLFSPPQFFIDDANEFTNKMFGIYNEDECADMFYQYFICPETAKKFDVYSNKYID